MSTQFDKNNVYTDEIEQKIIELKKICNKEKMPMFVAVCVKNDKYGTQYKKDVISADTQGIILTNDIIPKLINVTLGFDTVLPQNLAEINFD